MPPQSTNGMGGKETSECAAAASRVPLMKSAHPCLAMKGEGMMSMERSLDIRHNWTAYVYAFGFALVAAMAIYVFAFGN